jgi:hypothetical protein
MLRHHLLLSAVAACLLALFITAAGCTGTENADRDLGRATSSIVGSLSATQGQTYSTVAVTKAVDGTVVGSGKLVASTVVVTAAHVHAEDEAHPLIFTCLDDCEWEKKECDKGCRKIPEGENKRRERCWRGCMDDYAECRRKCKD